MRFAPIEGNDVSTITPAGGVLHVAGIIRSPRDLVSIDWEADNTSGSTQCEAWKGQHEIDCLANAGYKIIGVSVLQHA